MHRHPALRRPRGATRRNGFTLVELMIVVAIMLSLAVLTFTVYGNGRSSDKTRSAVRISQSAFLGAKDRALHAKEFRGVRLIRDFTDPSLVTGFVFLQPISMQTYPFGSIQLERVDVNPQDNNADSPDVVMVHGLNGTDWSLISLAPGGAFPSQGMIRIPSQTGEWYPFMWYPPAFNQSPMQNYDMSLPNKSPVNQYLQLLRPFALPGNLPPYVAAWNTSSQFSSCDIQMGNEVMPFHQPISLPAGIVIDLNFSSPNVQTLAANLPNIDIMFSPRGMLGGDIVSQGPLHFVVRDVRDATKQLNPADMNVQGEIMILSVFPQTGLVQTFDADLTPIIVPQTPLTPGIAKNLFRFAQQGKAAGQ